MIFFVEPGGVFLLSAPPGVKMLTPSQPTFKTFDTGLRVNLNDHIHELKPNWVWTICHGSDNNMVEFFWKFAIQIQILQRCLRYCKGISNSTNIEEILPCLSLGLHTLDLAHLVLCIFLWSGCYQFEIKGLDSWFYMQAKPTQNIKILRALHTSGILKLLHVYSHPWQ